MSSNHNLPFPIAHATLSSDIPIATGVRIGVEDDKRHSEFSQGSVLTNMLGPSGTRGRDAKEFDKGKSIYLCIV